MDIHIIDGFGCCRSSVKDVISMLCSYYHHQNSSARSAMVPTLSPQLVLMFFMVGCMCMHGIVKSLPVQWLDEVTGYLWGMTHIVKHSIFTIPYPFYVILCQVASNYKWQSYSTSTHNTCCHSWTHRPRYPYFF